VIDVAGPYFDELAVGQVFDQAPAMTLTDGHAAVHQAIAGDRLRLALDAELARAVVGGERPLAHPALVWDVAIGQSTLLTQRVIANLFYRRLSFRRAPLLGDTLHTTTEVVALRETTRRADRPPTGLVAMRVHTVDQQGRDVLDFWRCAMVPLSPGASPTGHDDDLDAVGAASFGPGPSELVAGWDLARFAVPGPGFADLEPGSRWKIHGRDVVSCAPELARLSLNVAMVHHDAGSAGKRLVYGGHTIGLAAAQATRALPNLVTIASWHGCDHLGPVQEGDTLESELELERVEPLDGGGGLVHLRSHMSSVRSGPVLDWRFVGVMA
jgi:acyl dehydratase